MRHKHIIIFLHFSLRRCKSNTVFSTLIEFFLNKNQTNMRAVLKGASAETIARRIVTNASTVIIPR